MEIAKLIERLQNVQALGATTVMVDTEFGLFTDKGPFLAWRDLREPVKVEPEPEVDASWKDVNIGAMQPIVGQEVSVLTSAGDERRAAWYRGPNGPFWCDTDNNPVEVLKWRA